MGTASLAIGFGLIAGGFYMMFFYEPINAEFMTEDQLLEEGIGALIISIPCIVIGALFLRKFDKDRKKEKAENS